MLSSFMHSRSKCVIKKGTFHFYPYSSSLSVPYWNQEQARKSEQFSLYIIQLHGLFLWQHNPALLLHCSLDNTFRSFSLSIRLLHWHIIYQDILLPVWHPLPLQSFTSNHPTSLSSSSSTISRTLCIRKQPPTRVSQKQNWNRHFKSKHIPTFVDQRDNDHTTSVPIVPYAVTPN